MERMCQGVSKLVSSTPGALADIFQYLESHRNDPATMSDLELALLKCGAGFGRNVVIAPYHVLIMLTRGRTRPLVLKAAELEGLESYRFLIWRYQPLSTVTSLAKLVDLFAISNDASFHCLVEEWKDCEKTRAAARRKVDSCGQEKRGNKASNGLVCGSR